MNVKTWGGPMEVGGYKESSGMQVILTPISADIPFEMPAGFL